MPVAVWIAAGTLSAAAAALCLRRSGLSRGALLVTVAAAVFCAGGLRYADYAQPSSSDVSFLAHGVDVKLFGTPFDAARTRSGIRFILEVDSVAIPQTTLPIEGRLLVYAPGKATNSISPCGTIRVDGRLGDLPSVRNPGDFDYGTYLRGRRIFARAYADSVQTDPAMSGFDVRCVAHRLKTTIEGYFESSIPDDAARAVILALVVGDRSAIDDATEERFRRTGLLHLLAVSGLHVLIVGMILYQLLRPMCLRMRLSWFVAECSRTTITAGVLAMYAVVTGLPASVVRAVVMATLFMLGTTFQRSSHSLNTLGVAIVVLLIARPPQLFEPGFQLSVAAVGAIITLQARFASAFESKKGGNYLSQSLRSSTAVSLAAAAGTLPVLLVHFGGVSFAGLFLNTVAVPLTSATLASSVTTAAASSMSDALGVTFGQASQFLARSLLYVVQTGEPYFRWAYLEFRVEDAPVIAALATALVMLVQWPRPRVRWRLCSLVLLFLLLDQIVDGLQGEWKPRMEVLFLDVGQGDAALLTFPNGRTMLVDAGPRTAYTDAGRYTVLPQLQRRRIRRLDAVVITHPDSDHLGGLPALLREIRVDRVLHSGRPHDSALYGETERLLDSLNVPYRALRTGDTLSVDPAVRVVVLHPDGPLLKESPNASSVVLHLRYGRSSFLLMGDAEREAEFAIVRRFGHLAAADVIKIGHHGSETSSSSLLLSRVAKRTSMGIISVAAKNRYGLPDSIVVRRLQALSVDVRRTDRHGAIRVVSDGRKSNVESWR